MLSAWGIRKFLLRQPRAELIRMTVRGVTQEIKPTRGQSLSKIGDTIFAVAPDIIELFDSDGKLVRAIRPEHEVETSVDQPKPPAGMTADPETLRLNHFASLLAKAYEHSTTVAFSKLVELVERIDARTDTLEERLEETERAHRRTLREQLEDARDEALSVVADARSAESSDKTEILETMLSAMMQGKAERAERAAGNGKGKVGV